MSFGKTIPVTGLVGTFPGHVSRLGPLNITARQVLPSTPNPISFGQVVVINPATNTYQSVADFIAGGGTFTAALFAGIAVEEVLTTGGYPYSPDAGVTGAYNPGNQCEAINFGTVSVPVNAGTPQSQGTVYVRISANGANTIVGGIEAASDTTHTVALTGVVFSTGVKDANSNAEITILNRVAA
jgi:hypothetical protein